MTTQPQESAIVQRIRALLASTTDMTPTCRELLQMALDAQIKAEQERADAAQRPR